ncbi:MAG: DMT family transporter [Deltaproteobacteria bacterium]
MGMTNWYVLSIVALVLMGVQRFLYKVSAERECDTSWTTFSFMATVTVLSVVFFISLEQTVSDTRVLLLTAGINSASFVLGTITHIEALKHVPSSVAYPIIRLNMVVVVLFSMLFLNDRVSLNQVMGILLAIAVIVILTRDAEQGTGSLRSMRKGLFLVFVSLVSGSVASISSKFAAVYSNKLGFMALSYFLGTVFSAALIGRSRKEEGRGKRKEAVLIGLVMGLINFAGFYTFLAALSAGPLSIIVSITGMHFVIAVLLSVIVYGEKLNQRRILGMTMAVVSILFLRA